MIFKILNKYLTINTRTKHTGAFILKAHMTACYFFEILLYSTFRNDKASEHAKDICVKIDNFIEFLPYCHFKEE